MPKAPAAIAPKIFANPIIAIENAPKLDVEFTPSERITLLGGIALHTSVMNAGK